MTNHRQQGLMRVATAVLLFTLGSTRAHSQDQPADFEYRCVVSQSPSLTDQAPALPEGDLEVWLGTTFLVEFWATDSGETNTGIVSAYTNLDYPEDSVLCGPAGSSTLFNLFGDGTCDGTAIAALGGSQLDGNVGTSPEWARVGIAEFVATKPCLLSFSLEPAPTESSAFSRGLVLHQETDYGICSVVSREPGGCCQCDSSCTDSVEEDECLVTNGRYLGDGVLCGGDPDGDLVLGCDDVCPLSPPAANVDAAGRSVGDLDEDCDVDLDDFGLFQQNFSGPSAICEDGFIRHQPTQTCP